MVRAWHGETLPDTRPSTTTTPIPKAEVHADTEEVRCTAATVRPITLMRLSAKLAGLVLNGELAPVASRSVAYPHHGFIVHMVIDDDILGFDRAMAIASLRPGGPAVGILFDFEVAMDMVGFLRSSSVWRCHRICCSGSCTTTCPLTLLLAVTAVSGPPPQERDSAGLPAQREPLRHRTRSRLQIHFGPPTTWRSCSCTFPCSSARLARCSTRGRRRRD